ncbi:MAG: NAD(P)/FAD-dependent oxidoreductase [Anaerolineae bacterium]|nr:NAD(P)/FAD-dependent oxidoreductase [Anaerolineae bacterium]
MFDVIVIGGGPAGVTAALRARELGANTALVERGRLGGICTNDGCAPTRVLAKAARLVRDSRQFESYGLYATPPDIDFARVIERTQQVIYQLQEKKQLIGHLEAVGVKTLHGVGNARFSDAHKITVANGDVLQSEKFILCAGGAARRLSFPGSEHTLTHSDVWSLKKLPKSVVIVGGGATGCQLASVFSAFGTQVTLIDVAPRILITEDQHISEAMRQAFLDSEINVITGISAVDSVEKLENEYRFNYSSGEASQSLTAEAVILAVGWPGNVPDLNLAAAGVETERNYIKVNDYLQSSAPNIYAAGDITGRMLLVQSASYQARIAAENALLSSPPRAAEHRLVPHGGFTDPEYGSVGMTEEQARAKGDPAIAVVPFADLDRAVIDGHTTGFCKLIVDRQTLGILGAHVVGEQAVEIVQLVSAGMAAGMKVQQLADLELAYPTYAAIVGLAARDISRQLKLIPVSMEWLHLNPLRGAEWERQES